MKKQENVFVLNHKLRKALNMAAILALAVFMSGSLTSCNGSKKMAKKELENRVEVAKQRLTAILDSETISIEDMEHELNEIKSWNFDTPKVRKLQPQIDEVKELMKQVDQKIGKVKKQQIEEVKIRLYGLLNNKTMGADDLERELNEIKALNIKDSEVNKLIKQVEDRIKELREDGGIIATNADMDAYFNQVVALAKTGNVETTNMKIKDILKFFTSPDAPLLIIVYKDNDIVDYDKPTTIGTYLNYLKDQKTNNNTTHSIERDNYGKIKLVELLKNK
ncbi:MAG: hypothetical protein LBH92_01995 [Bacteroidales bacterium]|jgi:hypothetical protein|nr:hypothetical protein [Bacteroidales bacterium]